MPTVLRVKGHRFFFFSHEADEPPHIHVAHAENYAKFWLNPVSLVWNIGFRSHELTELRRLVEDNRRMFEEKWHEHFEHQS
jgi:hypothetical protein